VETAENGTFSVTIELDYGENTITVNATVDGKELAARTMTVRYIPSE
jgi:hypothetical protein